MKIGRLAPISLLRCPTPLQKRQIFTILDKDKTFIFRYIYDYFRDLKAEIRVASTAGANGIKIANSSGVRC
jgi:hypothetical protein